MAPSDPGAKPTGPQGGSADPSRGPLFAFGRFGADERLRILCRDGERVHVQPRVLDLLFYLLKQRGRAVSWSEIQREVWSGIAVEASALRSALKKLRKILEDGGSSGAIQTVRGYGLRFAAELRHPPNPHRGAAHSRPPFRRAHALPGQLPGITVLHFDSIGGRDEEGLGAAIESELLIQLHEHRVLPVVPREFFMDETGRLSEDRAEKVGIRYAMAGSIGRDDAGVEATARLIDLARHRIVWSLRAGTPPGRVACSTRQLAQQLSASLWLAIMLGQVPVDRVAGQSIDTDAWKLTCDGWRLIWLETREGMQSALPLFDAALRIGDDNGWALTGRSVARFVEWYFAPQKICSLEAAIADASSALELDADAVLARTHLAYYLAARGDAARAAAELKHAALLCPGQPWIFQVVGDLDLMIDPDAAADAYENGISLDVSGKLHSKLLTGLATARRLAGDPEAALVVAERAIQAKPTVPYGYFQAAAACGALGRRERGELLLRQLGQNVRAFVPDWLRGHVSMKGARPEYREETLPFLRLAGWHDAL